MMAALISLVTLGLLVIVHEVGHLLVARRAGVRILRFSIGFGPRLMTWTRGNTEYAVSLIPLGGYVKMAGEQGASPAREPWEYLAQPAGVRAQIIFAGPLVNYLTAVVCLWVTFVIGYPELAPVVGTLIDGMPAQAAGVQVGDRIEAVQNRPIHSWDEVMRVIHEAKDQPVVLRVAREGAVQELTVTPRPKQITDPLGRRKTVGLIGIVPSGAFESRRVGPVAAIGAAFQKLNEWTVQTFAALGALLTGRLSVQDSVTGPIGIIYLTSEAVQLGVAPLLSLMGLFSLNLAIFNLLPIPVLDGGHLLFLIIGRLRGTPVSLTVQERSAQVSLALLTALVLVICANDVSRFGLLEKVLGWVRK